MFADEIKNFHRNLGEEEEQWIRENLENLSDDKKLNFTRALRNYKEITIMALQKVYQEITGRKPVNYYWAVCQECGCEYDYGMSACPECYDKGKETRLRFVKSSEFQPPLKVIRYNKQYLIGDKGEQLCYNCPEKKESYCKHFGSPDWNCTREEFEYCQCKACCTNHKKLNRAIKENKNA